MKSVQVSLHLSHQSMREQTESICTSSIEKITIKRVATLSREATDEGSFMFFMMPDIGPIEL